MQVISLLEKETETFNWDLPSGFIVNKKIQTPSYIKIYSHERYASALYAAYRGINPGNLESGKDLEEGKIYTCKITSTDKDSGLAHTETGQTIYLDLKKERRDAQKLGIQGLNFTIGASIKTLIKEIDGTYHGSVVDCYVQNLKEEFFEQIKSASNAYPARVEAINKGGYLVDISGVKCFLPGSLAAANKITDFESLVGKTIYVMIDGYVAPKDIFVVSYKKYLSKIIGQKIQELDLTKKYQGTVTGASSFGLFVEWEEFYTGLIHKTEFPNQMVQGYKPGDEIEFYVREVKEDNKLTLSFEAPVEKTVKLYEIKDAVENGSISEMAAVVKYRRKNGCLVELPESGLMAMIPQERIDSDADIRPGDRVGILIYEIDPVMGKIFADIVNG